jgi:HEAT repeat protein
VDVTLEGWIETLRGADPDARVEAARQLAALGRAAQQAAVPLAQAMADAEEEVREWVAAALEELGPPPATDVERLIALLAAPCADVAYWAATLLGRLAADAAPATSALAHVLSHGREPAVRERAAWALGAIGPSARPACDALRQAAQEAHPRLARLARNALASIG